MCRWKQCIFRETPFEYRVVYRLGTVGERPLEECRVPARIPQGPSPREARHVEKPVAEEVPVGSR